MIYFDNSATSYPKPWNVKQKIYEAMHLYSFNSGRGGYKASLRAAEKIYSVREKIADMFCCDAENVAFTKNCTEALNIAIKGSVKKGSHIVISSLEHNSVSRVIYKLFNDGIIDYSIAPFSFDKNETVKNFESAITPETALVVCTAASNAFGCLMPVREIGALCRKRNIRFVVDAAQSAGIYPINMVKDNIDILCAPGHKSLMGPMGTGFIAFRVKTVLKTITEGGTGSNSLSFIQPLALPDRYESGTLNNIGIIGLGAGIDYINNIGIDDMNYHEIKLIQLLYEALSNIDGVKLYTPFPESDSSLPVLSFNKGKTSSEETALMLSEKNICTRAGYHCAPLAHEHFNTLDTGTVRVSLGWFNTQRECERFTNVLKLL